jgi:hypothetical protein
MPQSTPSCLYLATTRSCFKVGGRQHASSRRIVTCIFRLQHRREQQINALVLWHASRLEQADSELYRRSVVVDGHGSKGGEPRRALVRGEDSQASKKPLNTQSEHAVSTDSTWRTIKNLKKAPLSFDCGSNHENLKRPVFLSAHFALLISNHY